ncbi:MAG: hypothetical protein IT441_07360 [Phycisphaeraceae bacterium]|nr:hypothetical protein [Phycisphaeraceae bacterium]
MGLKVLGAGEIEGLVGTAHAVVGMEYPPSGLRPYYHWLVQSLHLLAEASAGWLRVGQDSTGPAWVRVGPGRMRLDGQAWAYAGGVLDLGGMNNSTAKVWIAADGGEAEVEYGLTWPTTRHLKLAEVTLAGGEVVEVIDRRSETMLAEGYEAQSVELSTLTNEVMRLWPRYRLELAAQGTVLAPSVVRVVVQDARGMVMTDRHVVRVRVTQTSGYVTGTTATLTVGAGSQVVETVTAGKDVVVESDAGGVALVQVANASPGTMRLRVGPAPVGGVRADYAGWLDVTH